MVISIQFHYHPIFIWKVFFPLIIINKNSLDKIIWPYIIHLYEWNYYSNNLQWWWWWSPVPIFTWQTLLQALGVYRQSYWPFHLIFIPMKKILSNQININIIFCLISWIEKVFLIVLLLYFSIFFLLVTLLSEMKCD